MPDLTGGTSPSQTSTGSATVGRRLWGAMLALALVPMVAGIAITATLSAEPDPSVAAARARLAATAATGLTGLEQRIEARLVAAAADPGLSRLSDGISGAAERQLADRAFATLRANEGRIIRGACVVRVADRRSTPIGATRKTARRGQTCDGAVLRSRAASIGPGKVVRRNVVHDDGTMYVLIATRMRGSPGDRSILTAVVDLEAMFAKARDVSGRAAGSLLVDLSSGEVLLARVDPTSSPRRALRPAPAETPVASPSPSSGASASEPTGSPHVTVVAAAGTGVDGAAVLSFVRDASSEDGAPPTLAPTISEVIPLTRGIVDGHATTTKVLDEMGLAATVAPLWDVAIGSRLALLQLWPTAPPNIPGALIVGILILIFGVLMAVVALVRYFTEPLEELVETKAELELRYREARQDSLVDPLTGLGNSRAFQEELRRQVALAGRNGQAFALLLLDLDDLKVVNDDLGHAAGDRLLASLAGTMRDFARPSDFLFRIGGDEFAMIVPDTDARDAVELAQRLLHFCLRPEAGRQPSPFSCGVSALPQFARDPDDLYRQADAALYWAKRHGRAAVELFDPVRDQNPTDYAGVTGVAVREVIAGGMLKPVYQPIVDLVSGHVLGFEGLVRPDPRGPLSDTARLFAAAESSGRVVDLDMACVETVVAGAAGIGANRILTLNVSPRTLEVNELDPGWLLERLVHAGISPSRVIVEMTERDEVTDVRRLQATFEHLHRYGVRIAADDVGAGNAGLRLLSQLDFDIVKIDLSLVHDGVVRSGSRAVLASLRDLASSQQAAIIAEGVETSHQLRVIRELMIPVGQGYLLGRPAAAPEITRVDIARLAVDEQTAGPPEAGASPGPLPAAHGAASPV